MALLIASGTRAAHGQPEPDPRLEVRYAAGEVVVIPWDVEAGRTLAELFKSEEFTVLGFAPISGLMIVAVEPGLEEAAIEYFGQFEGVKAVERSYGGEFAGSALGGAARAARRACGGPGTPPTEDEGFEHQWHLQNLGGEIEGNVNTGNETVDGDCGVDIDAIRAWMRARGSPDIWMAIFDSGIDKYEEPPSSGTPYVNHEFEGRLAPMEVEICLSCAEVGDPNNSSAASTCCCTGVICDFGEAWDVGGHGTWVAAVAAANHDDVGVMGVDPGCTILPVRISSFDDGQLARTIIALEMIDDANGATEDYEHVRVINMSYSCASTDNESLQVDVLLSDLHALKEEGVFLVASSGNDDRNPGGTADYWLPSASPDVISVGATDNLDRRAAFTHIELGAFESGTGEALDFVAP